MVGTGEGAKVDDVVAAPPTISPGIQKTIQSIKEIVKDHSEEDIYDALKETDMEPNETIQKLLHRDPFHEVKRKRNRNKENVGNKAPVEPTKNQPLLLSNNQKRDFNNNVDNGQQNDEHIQRGSSNQRDGFNQIGGHSQKGGYIQRGAGIQRGYGFQKSCNIERVDDNQGSGRVRRGDGYQRDNGDKRSGSFQIDGDFQRNDYQRHNGFQRSGVFRRGHGFQRGAYVRNSLPGKSVEFRIVRDNRVNQTTISDVHQEAGSVVSSKGDSSGMLNNQKAAGSGSLSTENDKELKDQDERRPPSRSTNTRMQPGKSKDSRPRSAGQASNNSVLGVYSSSSDPVHVPSPARLSANGSFRREVGVVGARKMLGDISGKPTSSNAVSAKINPPVELAREHNVSPKNHQLGAVGAAVPSVSVSRPISSHRSHQQPAGHPKAVQLNKEWKPKSRQRSLVSSGIVGMSSETSCNPAEISADGLKDSNSEAGKLPANLTHEGSQENQSLIISESIRVPAVERCTLTFGSFGLDTRLPSSIAGSHTVGDTVEYGGEISSRMMVSTPDASNIDVAVHESPESLESDAVVDHQFSDGQESSSPQNLESYAEIGMVRNDSTSYTHSDLHKHQERLEMVYDSQTGYDMVYFRPATDEAARGVGLPTMQEGLNSHAAGMIPMSQALYQQQGPVPQMYQQVHVSHYMPYRPFIPPVYVSQMGIPGYSPDAAYSHPANGNGYVLIPGGSSHVNPSAMKYGAQQQPQQQQFKPVSGGSPTGFGNYATPNGYAVNAPGGMMRVAGLDDPYRLKYKDASGNIYVQNPQAEAQEMWMQLKAREMPGLQASPYYNMQGQPPHGTYIPPHTGHHAAYNPAAAVAQSSHMQFPGLYQAQVAPIPSPHHMAPANVGVGVPPAVAPMAQVGAYPQQPQMNHIQWTTKNF